MAIFGLAIFLAHWSQHSYNPLMDLFAHGRQEQIEVYRGRSVVPNLIPKIRLDIAVNEDFVAITVDTIIAAAKSEGGGQVGDGKIFITPLEECIRIRTEERGGIAI